MDLVSRLIRTITVLHDLETMIDDMRSQLTSGVDVDDLPKSTDPLTSYLMHLKYVDGGKTYKFDRSSGVSYRIFRLRAIEWVITQVEGGILDKYEDLRDDVLDWLRLQFISDDNFYDDDVLEFFNLRVDGDKLVGLRSPDDL